MQWFGKGSENIEDRRGMGGGGLKIGGGIVAHILTEKLLLKKLKKQS